jgi:ribosomal protein S15P/S13E
MKVTITITDQETNTGLSKKYEVDSLLKTAESPDLRQHLDKLKKDVILMREIRKKAEKDFKKTMGF